MLIGNKWVLQKYPTSRFKKYCCKDHNRRGWLFGVCNTIEREKRRGEQSVLKP